MFEYIKKKIKWVCGYYKFEKTKTKNVKIISVLSLYTHEGPGFVYQLSAGMCNVIASATLLDWQILEVMNWTAGLDL